MNQTDYTHSLSDGWVTPWWPQPTLRRVARDKRFLCVLAFPDVIPSLLVKIFSCSYYCKLPSCFQNITKPYQRRRDFRITERYIVQVTSGNSHWTHTGISRNIHHPFRCFSSSYRQKLSLYITDTSLRDVLRLCLEFQIMFFVPLWRLLLNFICT